MSSLVVEQDNLLSFCLFVLLPLLFCDDYDLLLHNFEP